MNEQDQLAEIRAELNDMVDHVTLKRDVARIMALIERLVEKQTIGS